MKHFKKYIANYWTLALLSILCVSLEAICDLFQPKLMSRLVDNGVLAGNTRLVVSVGLTMLGVVALGSVFALSRNIASSYVSQNFGCRLRDDLYQKIQSLPIQDIDRFETGSLITRMTNDVTQIQNFVNMMLRIFFKAPVVCIGAIVMVSTLNIRAVFLVIPVALCVFGVIGVSMKLSYPRFAKMQKAIDKINTTMREYLTGIRLVKAFRRFDAEERRFGSANNELADRSVEAGRVSAVLAPCMQLFSGLGIAGIIFLGGRWVGAGVMEIGSIMAFVIYMQQITQSFHMISNLLNHLVRVKASGERIAEIFAADSLDFGTGSELGELEEVKAHSPDGDAASGVDVEFCNVRFTYRDSTGQPALDGLTFRVPAGATIGIIGSTGSGKTTLASLLARFYLVNSGSIKLNGVDIADIPEAVLRSKVAIVPQTPALFTGTVRDNILFGSPGASACEVEDEVFRAAELAQAHEFILALKDGYDTIIGQNGVNLSGGQKQRISIARALLRRPQMLLLDDCTSALDATTEAKVLHNLAERAGFTTRVLITQRIGTVMRCDDILALDNGRIMGQGSHRQLLQHCALYQDIYRSQIGLEDEGGGFSEK